MADMYLFTTLLTLVNVVSQVLVPCYTTVTLGSLSNDDGDVNEDDKKAIGLDRQNNNFARPTRFFVHFFAVVARLHRENA